MSKKKIINDLSLTGEVAIVLRDIKTGRIKARREVNNLVVQSGKDLVATVFAGSAGDTITHIGLGEGNTPASLGQTALVTPLLPRVSVTGDLNTSPASIVYQVTFGAGVAVGDISEAGLFTAATSGTMVARTTFASIPKEADDELILTWTLIFG